ncbi:MAG: hypothetical protein J7L88_03815 [Thermoplasmata archaeon]|nr:hypothetical protein [Thermoplasmata archaeon]
MASAVDKLIPREIKEMDPLMLLIVIAGVVLIVAGLVAALSNVMGNPGTYEPQGVWEKAKADVGIAKQDSDTIFMPSMNTKIPWPDKLSDIEENYIYGTDPTKPDTDGDGMEDGWEAFYGVINPITGRLTLDPSIPDWRENPDGDGFDANGNGKIDKNEEYFNLREYCGGAEYDYEKNEFISGPFAGLSPTNPDHLKIIAMRGGFHLVGDEKAYARYNPYIPGTPPVTTNPSRWDTDGDGMDDGWEVHAKNWIMENLFTPDGKIRVYSSAENVTIRGEISGAKIMSDYQNMIIDPLSPKDADEDIDVRYVYNNDTGAFIWLYQPDMLTNYQEYVNHTVPYYWDTDNDSYYDSLTKQFYDMSDYQEVSIIYNQTDSAVDWNGDGINDYKTCPYKADTDGDLMPDGWELLVGLNPLNATDRFLDLDGDGLPNILEFRYPATGEQYFTTDPRDPDTDDDGIPDGWEVFNALLLKEESTPDRNLDESDGLLDGLFRIWSTNPMIPDSGRDSDVVNYTLTLYYDEVLNKTVKRISYVSQEDGLTNLQEYTGTPLYPVSTDPNNPDTDGDGLTDGEELMVGFHGELIGEQYFTNPLFTTVYYTNATLADSDADFDPTNESRVLDDWEETHGITKKMVPPNGFDDDGDGVVDNPETNGYEYLVFPKTNATNPDTDLDGLRDVDEVFGIWTGEYREKDPTSGFGWIRPDPTKKDTDTDGVSDKEEVIRVPNYKPWVTDPMNPDTDGDLMEDGLEYTVDFFPWVDWNKGDNYDAEGDGDYSGPNDVWCTIDRTNPRKADTDGDGMPDGWEYDHGYVIAGPSTRPMIARYDQLHGTNWANSVPDGVKVWLVNPLIGEDKYDDLDNDELTNIEEYMNDTEPLNPDTDGDGMPDGWEVKYGKPVVLWDNHTHKHRNILDPTDPTDWCYDPDHDGFTYAFWTKGGEYVYYYFPWINLYEYQYGIDTDGDGINEITLNPFQESSDGDPLPDGWEVWTSDFISNESHPVPFEDNDSLPAGWEALFNGSWWNREECYIYEEPPGPPDPWRNSIGQKVFVPRAVREDLKNLLGKLDPNKKDTNGAPPNDGGEDLDSDGFTNYDEYIGHTDPTDSTSTPGSHSSSTRGVVDNSEKNYEDEQLKPQPVQEKVNVDKEPAVPVERVTPVPRSPGAKRK